MLDIVATFGFVRETNYGELFDVRIEPDPSNLAFTGLAGADGPGYGPLRGAVTGSAMSSAPIIRRASAKMRLR